MLEAVFIGVELQRDHTESAGALLIDGAAGALRSAKRLTDHALEKGIPLILTRDTHEDDDPIFEAFPPHCVTGTPGRDLAPALGLEAIREIPDRPTADISFENGPLLVDSPTHRRGMLGNLNADAVLEASGAQEHVVFGLPLETGVRALVMGLLARGRTTIVVSDALGFLDSEHGASCLAAMAGRGCRFLTVDGVIERFA